jgi:hypothetical protein
MSKYVNDRFNQVCHIYSYRSIDVDEQQLKLLQYILALIIDNSNHPPDKNIKAQTFIIKGEDGNFYQAVKEVPIPYGQSISPTT